MIADLKKNNNKKHICFQISVAKTFTSDWTVQLWPSRLLMTKLWHVMTKPFTCDRTVHLWPGLKDLSLSRPGAKFPGLKRPDAKSFFFLWGGGNLGTKMPGPNIQIRIFRVLSVGCEMPGSKTSRCEACEFQTSSCEKSGDETFGSKNVWVQNILIRKSGWETSWSESSMSEKTSEMPGCGCETSRAEISGCERRVIKVWVRNILEVQIVRCEMSWSETSGALVRNVQAV